MLGLLEITIILKEKLSDVFLLWNLEKVKKRNMYNIIYAQKNHQANTTSSVYANVPQCLQIMCELCIDNVD